jgi:hypothetical protein
MSEICLQSGYFCQSCGSHWDVPDACKCTTEGIQHTMDFDSSREPDYASYDSFLKFDDQGIILSGEGVISNAMFGSSIDPVLLTLGKEMAYKMGESLNSMISLKSLTEKYLDLTPPFPATLTLSHPETI